jgi:hypothetical protein
MDAFKVAGSAKAFLYCNTTGTLRNKIAKYNFKKCRLIANIVMLHNIIKRLHSSVLYYNPHYSLFFYSDCDSTYFWHWSDKV